MDRELRMKLMQLNEKKYWENRIQILCFKVWWTLKTKGYAFLTKHLFQID